MHLRLQSGNASGSLLQLDNLRIPALDSNTDLGRKSLLHILSILSDTTTVPPREISHAQLMHLLTHAEGRPSRLYKHNHHLHEGYANKNADME